MWTFVAALVTFILAYCVGRFLGDKDDLVAKSVLGGFVFFLLIGMILDLVAECVLGGSVFFLFIGMILLILFALTMFLHWSLFRG